MMIQELDTPYLSEARLTVLEMTVASLIAQLPSAPREEVVGMLVFVADASGEAQQLTNSTATSQLDEVRFWAAKMLERAMESRSAARRSALSPLEAALNRHGSEFEL